MTYSVHVGAEVPVGASWAVITLQTNPSVKRWAGVSTEQRRVRKAHTVSRARLRARQQALIRAGSLQHYVICLARNLELRDQPDPCPRAFQRILRSSFCYRTIDVNLTCIWEMKWCRKIQPVPPSLQGGWGVNVTDSVTDVSREVRTRGGVAAASSPATRAVSTLMQAGCTLVLRGCSSTSTLYVVPL